MNLKSKKTISLFVALVVATSSTQFTTFAIDLLQNSSKQAKMILGDERWGNMK